MSVSLSHKSLRSRRALLAVAAAALALPAGSASAATTSLKITDPANDGTGGAALEITGATVTQDTSKGTVSATVTFGATPPGDANLAIALGTLKNGSCIAEDDATTPSFAFIGLTASPPSAAWLLTGQPAPVQVSPTLSGTTFKVATGSVAALKKFTWNCSTVSIQQAVGENGDSIGDNAAASGPGSGGAQTVVLTDKPDGDKDGVPDVADACPSVAGSSANGCLEIAAKLALRLGAKRVAIDIMVPRTGATCGATAKATAKDGSKTIGKGTLDVGVHGSFCHISGVIKTKKHGKKVKVKIAGSGFKTISKSIKK